MYKTNLDELTPQQLSVVAYLDKRCYSPLHFKYEESLIKDTGTLKELIIKIIEKTKTYHSYAVNNRISTERGRSRSHFDICRHLQIYRPDVDPFEVMREMFQLSIVEGKIGGAYCGNVHRRVWRTQQNWEVQRVNTYHTDHPDEYGLYLVSWEHIGEQGNIESTDRVNINTNWGNRR